MTDSQSSKQRDRSEYIFSGSLMVIALALIVYIWLQPWAYRETPDRLGIPAMPTAYLTIVVITSAARLVIGIRRKPQPAEVDGDEACPLWPIIALSGVVVVGAQAIWRIDPILVCSLMVLLLTRLAGIRDWRLLAGLSVGTGLLLYVLFIRVLGIFFPSSWLW